MVTTAELLDRARSAGRGVGAFNVITLEHAEAVVGGAEQADRPVILQVSQNAVRFHQGRVAPLAAALRQLARAASAEVSLHLDHVADERLLHEAGPAGFSSVMFDGSTLDYADNVIETTRAARWAHHHGLLVEAELGHVGGKASQAEDAHQPGVRTDPDQAAAFVDATGVDALAVAVGSSHAMTEQRAVLDLGLIRRLHDRLPVPLVLHGSSGVPDAMIISAVAAGLTKINIGTATAAALTGSIRRHLQAHPDDHDPRHHLVVARDAVSELVARLLTVIDPARPAPTP